MNKLISMSLLTVCLVISACSGSSGDDSKPTPPVTINEAPTINLASTQTVASGQSVTLSATVSDPEGDTLNFLWKTDNPNINFATTNEASTLVTFPDTNIDMEITITLVATDAKNNSSQKNITITLQAEQTSNNSPIITMASEQEAQGNSSIVLVASVQEPQGDDYTVEWKSDNNDIVFSDKTSVTPTLTLPDVNSELTATLTLVATDSQQNKSEKSLVLTIVPNDGVVTPRVNFELLDRFDTVSGNVTTLTAKVTSNVDIKEVLWNLSALNVEDAQFSNITINGIKTSTATFTAPIVDQLSEFTVQIRAITFDNVNFEQSSKVYVAVANTDTLNVTLPNSINIDENSSSSITPTIESSQAIDSYQWQWLSNQELTLVTPSSKTLSLSAPNVDIDIKGQLSLTVTMGDLSQTVVTELTIKNNVTISEISLTASRLVAVKGQKINVHVITDDTSQITDWSWEISGVQGTDLSESKNELEITAPAASGQQSLNITYIAKLTNNTEISRVVNVTLLSEASARSSFSFDMNSDIEIYKGVEKVLTSTFADPHGLVDTISLNKNLTFTDFDKAELTRNGDQITLTFMATDLVADYLDFIHLDVVYGDYIHQYTLKLQMKMN